ncbi:MULTISPECIES: TolC family protein [unclassified Thiocapsa]|uniref:TolC family protein n=1 Tax=unclassified Thiocapsa TaxID=2641286 RepID=UPI0035B0E96E
MRTAARRYALGCRILVLLAGATLTVPAAAISDPLGLEEALETVTGHPRVTASPEIVGLLPRRQSLYLDCQRLAFRSSSVADPERNRPLQPLISARDAQRLEIMERFFDVLLADLSFSTESEAMAVAYIQFDRASVRNELGQISPLRVLELESVYQEILHRRSASEISQQLTRALLAQALGNPADLPRNLLQPTLTMPPETPPTLETILAQAVETPIVRDLIAGRSQADRDLIHMEIRQQALELLLRLRALSAAERNLRTELAWRDLKLDESRTLYEQEVTADLGYSMSQQTQTRQQSQRVSFCRALVWAELEALAGQPLAEAADGEQNQ